MAVITTDKLGAVGALVQGLDCDRLLDDAALPAWCLETLEANGVLVFPELHIDDATQVAFGRKLGPTAVVGSGSEFPEIYRVTLDPAKNPAADYLRGTVEWHIDGTTDEIPAMATMLSAHTLAESGGETEFVSTYVAYDDLSDEEKERFLPLRVVHSLEASQRAVNPDPSPEQLAQWRARPAAEHPLVWQHRSGRRSLVIGSSASHVVGKDFDEGRALLDDLVVRSTGPDRVYRHEWKPGDLVIWDNRGVMHRVCPYDPASPREMHRTTIEGDEAIQ